MMRLKRTLSVLLAFLCIAACAGPILPAAAQQEDGRTVIEIGTAEQLLAFSEHCVYDSYGDRIKAVLTKDIDLSGHSWLPVAIFGGVFDGAGHTVTHADIRGIGSELGFFRRIKKGGVVRNLHVEGTIEPSGTKARVGGLAGVNRGVIENCSFSGKVTASEYTGGIAGYNYGTGQIRNTLNKGEVQGEKCTGGIAGGSEGVIEACKNYGKINTRDAENRAGEDGMGGNTGTQEDTGGIAGYSKGTTEDCENYGEVGYEHVGYNLGGIVGRLDGAVHSCSNNGEINGRKDVGGIAGQFEPYLTLVYEEDTLQALTKAFSGLTGIADEVAGQAAAAAGNGSRHIRAVNRELDKIRSIGRSFSDTAGTDLGSAWDNAYDALAQIRKEVSELVEDTGALQENTEKSLKTIRQNAETIYDILDGAGKDGGKSFRTAYEAVSGYLDQMTDEVNKLVKELDEKSSAASDALERIQKNIKIVRDTLETLSESINGVVNSTLDLISGELDQIEGRLLKAGETDSFRNEISLPEGNGREESLDKAEKALAGLDKTVSGMGPASGDLEEIRDSIARMRKSIQDAKNKIASLTGDAYDKIKKALNAIDEDGGILEKNTGSMLSDMHNGLKNLNDSFTKLKKSLDEAYDMAESGKGAGELDQAVRELRAELDGLMEAAGKTDKGIRKNIKSIQAQMTSLGNILDNLAGRADKNFRAGADGLSEALQNINREINEITKETDETAAGLSQSFEKLKKQVELIEAIAGDAAGTDNSGSDLIKDVSDETDPDYHKGAVTKSQNRGRVTADVNAGGVAGIIASELSGDPEKDLDIVEIGEKSLRSYRYARATVSGSGNSGAVTVKNNYGGGIAGRADLGAIVSCLNTGNVESQDGNYAGGIAGMSAYVIRECYALCDLKGRDNIGGVAGRGSEIYDCYTMVRIESEGEKLGAIAGMAGNRVLRNYFIKEGLAGMNGVNYDGQAMPLTYEEMKASGKLPDAFLNFHVSFMAEGKTIKTVNVSYGAALPESEFPSVPQKEGFYARWEPFQAECITRNVTVNAEYLEWTKTISSGGNKPLILIEGAFAPDAAVLVGEPEGGLSGTGRRILGVYEFSIENSGRNGSQPLKVRVLAPQEEGGNQIALVMDGRLKNVSCEREGSYLVFQMQQEGGFAVISGKAEGKPAILFSAAVLLAAAAVITAVLLRHRAKRRHGRGSGERK